ncbi:hypothetical protein CFN17_10565 [Arthrobacter sp. PM3]|nr:hypothetical protein CFN17_10565 [Arthrobacter sp. PM3]
MLGDLQGGGTAPAEANSAAVTPETVAPGTVAATIPAAVPAAVPVSVPATGATAEWVPGAVQDSSFPAEAAPVTDDGVPSAAAPLTGADSEPAGDRAAVPAPVTDAGALASIAFAGLLQVSPSAAPAPAGIPVRVPAGELRESGRPVSASTQASGPARIPTEAAAPEGNTAPVLGTSVPVLAVSAPATSWPVTQAVTTPALTVPVGTAPVGTAPAGTAPGRSTFGLATTATGFAADPSTGPRQPGPAGSVNAPVASPFVVPAATGTPGTAVRVVSAVTGSAPALDTARATAGTPPAGTAAEPAPVPGGPGATAVVPSAPQTVAAAPAAQTARPFTARAVTAGIAQAGTAVPADGTTDPAPAAASASAPAAAAAQPAVPGDALAAAAPAAAGAGAAQPPAAGAAMPQPATHTASHAAAPLQPQLAKPLFTLVGAPHGQHVMTLKVSPEDLGPLTVRAHIDAGGVRIELFAPGEVGREAVRGILPELRKELADAGFGASLDLSDHSGPGNPGQNSAGQNSTGQDRPGNGPTGAGSSGAGRDSAGNGPGGRNGAGEPRPGHRWGPGPDEQTGNAGRIPASPQTTLDILV